MSDHIHAHQPEAPIPPFDQTDPECDSCRAKRSAVGGEFHTWLRPDGEQDVYCDVCHTRMRHDDALDEALARALAPIVKRWQKEQAVELDEILRRVNELTTLEAECLERMFAGEHMCENRPFRTGDEGFTMRLGRERAA